jgi:hypothetical protein
MVRLDRTISIKTMLRAMVRSSRTMTGGGESMPMRIGITGFGFIEWSVLRRRRMYSTRVRLLCVNATTSSLRDRDLNVARAKERTVIDMKTEWKTNFPIGQK